MSSSRTPLLAKMRGPWLEEKQRHQKKHDSWAPLRPPRYRFRRPVLLSVCAIVLILLWHFGAPDHIPNGSKSNAALKLNRRSQRLGNFASSEEGRTERMAVPDTPGRLQEEDALLTEETSQATNRHGIPDEKDSVQGVQLGRQHLEHQHDNDEVVAGNEEYEHDEHLPREKLVDGEDALVNEGDNAKSKGRALEEEHNPDHNSDSQKQELLLEEKAEARVRAYVSGKEGVIESPEIDVKPGTKPIEKEPEEHLSFEEKGKSLPEILHIPFEDAVADMTLAGWEDEWVADASFNVKHWGQLEEPKIDFIYLWVNGSEEAFQNTKRPFEENSVLNDPEGIWLKSHGTNRYRDWDELKYSLRSIEKYASGFRNKMQILVNSVEGTTDKKQVPTWLNDNPVTTEVVQVLAQEDFFDSEKYVCLPTFNSLTIENQIFNTPSNVDSLFALSDDMMLGRPHSASDIYSPLFGPVMGFKTNAYNTVNPPTDADAHRFGEKPFLIYTSWLLNRRFGNRKRPGQGHFGHSLSRTVTREAIGSFPGPELQSACERFRG
jgi:hypothetical protein